MIFRCMALVRSQGVFSFGRTKHDLRVDSGRLVLLWDNNIIW